MERNPQQHLPISVSDQLRNADRRQAAGDIRSDLRLHLAAGDSADPDHQLSHMRGPAAPRHEDRHEPAAGRHGSVGHAHRAVSAAVFRVLLHARRQPRMGTVQLVRRLRDPHRSSADRVPYGVDLADRRPRHPSLHLRL